MNKVIFKLAQGANFLTCSEMFAIRKSIVSLVLHEFVVIFISTYNDLIILPQGEAMAIVMDDFKVWCGLLNVQGAIDGMHISILKHVLFLEDYYYHKLDGYSLVAQAIVDCKKRFTNVFVGLLGSVNDWRVLCEFVLYRKVENHGLFAYDPRLFQHGFPPYLLGDKGYPLIT